MRTTLTIHEDVFLAARDHASVEGRTIGEVISNWARAGLKSTQRTPISKDDDWLIDQGLMLLPRRDTTVTNADVNRLRDELFL
ncbi:MAG: hypothetical protein FWG47_01750 [Propionibacteriaceae bacterium]|nr:hypothetical protein [Propionibacteriaceae bacterium]